MLGKGKKMHYLSHKYRCPSVCVCMCVRSSNVLFEQSLSGGLEIKERGAVRLTDRWDEMVVDRWKGLVNQGGQTIVR